jgi:hypothetical protein
LRLSRYDVGGQYAHQDLAAVEQLRISGFPIYMLAKEDVAVLLTDTDEVFDEIDRFEDGVLFPA